MNELRWHPLLREWVVVAAHRQDRPQLPADWCPFCPGSGRVPEQYEVHIYANDFAAFRTDNEPFSPGAGLLRRTGARGATDVVLYHPSHTLAPSQLPAEHWEKIIQTWIRRERELAARADIQYVYIFENTGTAIGVTMPHPHGQIYAFPFVPPLIEREMQSAFEYYQRSHSCIYCQILSQEMLGGERLVVENGGFVAFVPYFARWPGEVHIYPRRHFAGISELAPEERSELAKMIKVIRMKYDHLYGFQIPLMMVLRNRPVNGAYPHFHFHIEFLPIQRSATKLKYLAGVESGAGIFLNDTVAEEKARQLRSVEPQT